MPSFQVFLYGKLRTVSGQFWSPQIKFPTVENMDEFIDQLEKVVNRPTNCDYFVINNHYEEVYFKLTPQNLKMLIGKIDSNEIEQINDHTIAYVKNLYDLTSA